MAPRWPGDHPTAAAGFHAVWEWELNLGFGRLSKCLWALGGSSFLIFGGMLPLGLR